MEKALEQLNAFWAIVVDVWNQGLVGGASVGSLMTAFGIFFVFMLIRHAVTKYVIHILKKLVKRTTWTLDDAVIDAIAGPIRFIPVLLGIFFAFQYSGIEYLQSTPLGDDNDTIGDYIIRSLVIYTLFWIVYNLVKPLSVLMHRLDEILSREIIDWAVKALKVLVVLMGAGSILSVWNIPILPLLGSLGLFTVAVALGAQDLFKNLIAGILILTERRFHKGDWIKVDGVTEGNVENIGFRSTRVRRFDKAPMQVPNSQLSDNPVINFSEMSHRRIRWIIGVEYRTSVDQLREIRDGIEAYVLNNDKFAKPPEVPTFVRIDSFNDSSIDILLYCFTKTIVWGEWLKAKEELAYEVKKIVEGAGTGFAFPSQSLYVESLPDEAPERFIPPTNEKAKGGNSGKAAKSAPGARG